MVGAGCLAVALSGWTGPVSGLVAIVLLTLIMFGVGRVHELHRPEAGSVPATGGPDAAE